MRIVHLRERHNVIINQRSGEVRRYSCRNGSDDDTYGYGEKRELIVLQHVSQETE